MSPEPLLGSRFNVQRFRGSGLKKTKGLGSWEAGKPGSSQARAFKHPSFPAFKLMGYLPDARSLTPDAYKN
jgi:hypothetical protein